MRVTYVTRSFLDYRIPVLESLNEKLDGAFHVIYSGDYVPARVRQKVQNALGPHAIGMSGEKRIGPDAVPAVANSTFRVVYQPGLIREIGRTRPDVLVGDGFFQWTVFALIYKLRRHIPLVLCYERTFHTERNAQWIRRVYRRLVINLVDAMAVNGRLSMEYTRSLGMPASRMTTGQMVADVDKLLWSSSAIRETDRTAMRSRWGNPELVFLAVGKIITEKGVKQLLIGWQQLELVLPGKRALVFAGTGRDEQEFRQFAREAGLKNVFFEGAVDYDRLPVIYAAADVFVMPSLEDNWSLVVPEAMACGLPVLCSIYNGCYPELVEEDSNGWTFDPLDETDTLRVLRTAVEHRGELRDMGDRSREIVLHHRPEHAAEAILNACRIACRKDGQHEHPHST